MTMPEQKPHRSKQDYSTPMEFIEAVVNRFGKLEADLAASRENAKADFFIGEDIDSLAQPWGNLPGNLWLNPPFERIGRWAKKCVMTDTWRDRRILLLVPASVGSDWYSKFVQEYSYVLALSPRLTFDGCDAPYPKDLILAVYGNGFKGFDTWRWK